MPLETHACRNRDGTIAIAQSHVAFRRHRTIVTINYASRVACNHTRDGNACIRICTICMCVRYESCYKLRANTMEIFSISRIFVGISPNELQIIGLTSSVTL